MIFCLEFALAHLLISWGGVIGAAVGHSAGEYVAAALAGVMDVDDVVVGIELRCAALESAPPGGMLAVIAEPDAVQDLLAPGVVVGAINGTGQTVIAGPTGPLSLTLSRLIAAHITCATVPSTRGFHSPSVAPACLGTDLFLRGTTLQSPTIPLFSGAAGGRLSESLALSPEFWRDIASAPVLFHEALTACVAHDRFVYVELGAGQGLSLLARRHAGLMALGDPVVPLLPAKRRRGPSESDFLTSARTRLEQLGALSGDAGPRFARSRHRMFAAAAIDV